MGLLAGETLAERIRALLGKPFELSADEGELDVRLVGPDMLKRDGARSLRRPRLSEPPVPTVGLLPREVSAATVRDYFREEVTEVVFTDELEATLPGALLRAVERARARDNEEETVQHMAVELGSRARRLANTLEKLQDAYDETLAALVAALDSRERETACHSQRVAAFTVLLGIRAEIPEDDLEDLYRGALLHDIGKIGIPDAILLKPGSLSPEEWEVMRRHPEIGGQILEGISFLDKAVEVPLGHHEAWNGDGYPRGLCGEDIPIAARIFSVMDTYDALRSERPYKAALAHEASVDIIRPLAESKLDPRLVEYFCAEPETSWIVLAEAAERSGTFHEALRVCREELSG